MRHTLTFLGGLCQTICDLEARPCYSNKEYDAGDTDSGETSRAARSSTDEPSMATFSLQAIPLIEFSSSKVNWTSPDSGYSGKRQLAVTKKVC